MRRHVADDHKVLQVKRDHVRHAQQTRRHTCHWPGCGKQVPPAMWGCKPHWFRMPRPIRERIWRAYRPGQENDLQPSTEYLQAADAAQRWIRQLEHPAPRGDADH